METLYVVRVPMTDYQSGDASDYAIKSEEEWHRGNGIAYAGDPGELLATIELGKIKVKQSAREASSEDKELELLKSLRSYTGHNLMECKMALKRFVNKERVRGHE